MAAHQGAGFGQDLCRRHEGERSLDGYLPPFQRVSHGDDIPGQQVFQALICITAIRRMNDLELCLESLHPVLLALTGKFTQPTMVIDLKAQTSYDSRNGCLKTAPVRLGTQGMNAVTINTAVTFEPDQLGMPVKIPRRITMPPEVVPAAVRTHIRPRPWVTFPQ